jgi:hypothetical protein
LTADGQPSVPSKLDVVAPISANLDVVPSEQLGLLTVGADIIMRDDDGLPEPKQESLSDGHEDGETAKRRKVEVASEQVKPPKKSPTPGM